MHLRTAMVLAVVATCLASVSRAAEMVLVDDGVSAAPIVIPADGPPRTREVAEELAGYIEKISGARPQIIVGAPDPLPSRAIWVGYQPAMRRVFLGVDFDFKSPEETLIVCDGSNLAIAGRDRWDPEHMEAKGRLTTATERQQEYGTLNAVYTFIQDDLKVRWFWPGDLGEDVLPSKRIAFAPFQKRYHPEIRARGGMFVRLSLGDSKEGPAQLWARRQRVQLGSLELAGGHAFNSWWEKYHETHPDYFALQPNGARVPVAEPNTVKMCLSNPAVWQQWLTNVDEALKDDPTLRVFNASENDGYTNGYCTCPNCRAWDNPNAEKIHIHWSDKASEDMPMMTERQVTFANHLAALLKQKYPGRELYVQIHAYGSSRPAPIVVRPADNVIISSVANFHLRGKAERTLAMKQFDDWSKLGTQLAWRPNLGQPAGPLGLHWGLPDGTLTQAIEDFRFVGDRHCLGLYFDTISFHWSTQGPYYYLVSHLAWDPHADGQAVMDDYCRRGFGAGGAEMRAYLTYMDQTRQGFVDSVASRSRAFLIPATYTPEVLAKAQAMLDAAAAKVAAGPGVYRQRVDFVRFGFEHTKLVIDTRAWMQKFEASRGKDTAAAEHVKANWVKAEAMKKAAPPLAINYREAFGGPTSKYFVGLHPDNPISTRILKEMKRDGLE